MSEVNDKEFDSEKPYRLAFVVTKGDAKAEILTRMTRGIQVAYKDCYDAEDELNKILELAKTIPGEFNCYGAGLVIDEQNNKIEFYKTIR
jgi:hypothetical protein